jgi:hypothetical protein
MEKLTLELTQEEARGLLNCLMRTHAKGKDLDVGEIIEEKLWEYLKPLESKEKE